MASSTSAQSELGPTRWLQFRLRTLFLLMLIAAAAFSYCGWVLRHRDRELKLVREATFQVGVWATPSSTTWARFGWYPSVAVDGLYVRFDRNFAGMHPLDFERWQRLAELRHLEVLLIAERDLVVDELRVFADAPLHTLTLLDCDLAPGVLEVVGSMRSLRSLCLTRSAFDEEELVYLKNLPHLQRLELTETEISEGAVAHLNGLRSLRELHLDDTALEAEVVQPLVAERPNLVIRGATYTLGPAVADGAERPR